MKRKLDGLGQDRLTYLVLFTIGVYTLPWLQNPGAALTGNAYELAEWATLHPAILNGVSPLTTAFLLRLPLVLIACVAAYDFGRAPTLMRFTVLIALLLASVPPLEFLSNRSNDNYLQQFALTIAAATGSVAIIAIFRLRPSIAKGIILLLCLVGSIASVLGMFQVRDLMVGFSMPVEIGIGGLLSALGFVLICLSLLIPAKL